MTKSLACVLSLVLFLINPWLGFGLMLYSFCFFHFMERSSTQDEPEIADVAAALKMRESNSESILKEFQRRYGQKALLGMSNSGGYRDSFYIYVSLDMWRKLNKLGYKQFEVKEKIGYVIVPDFPCSVIVCNFQ